MNQVVTLPNKINESIEEAFRTLRTNIQFCSEGKNIKTICLTSCTPNEGKSTTAINLAISLASTNKNVLLIDADMRKHRKYRDITARFNDGLSNCLSGMAEYDDAISMTNFDNLQIMQCGPKPPNPAELLGSCRFKELLAHLDKSFDYIIIDTPPLGGMIDAAIIASETDGTILLIEANSVDYKKVLKVKEQLEKANAKILGVVLNKISRYDFENSYYKYKNYDKKAKKARTIFRRIQ